MIYLFTIILLLLAEEAFAQTCSRIGQFTYCDSAEGSTILSPIGKDRGVILGPKNSYGTYSTLPSITPGQPPTWLYIDRANKRTLPVEEEPRYERSTPASDLDPIPALPGLEDDLLDE
jgi:hypothetical protein